jgi:hypothetical protein
MEMLEELRMDQVGVLHANMELDNVKEISSNLALSRNMIGILKVFPWLFAYKLTVLTGTLKERNAHLNMELIGLLSKPALPEPKEFNM